jgi:hypothetical protein
MPVERFGGGIEHGPELVDGGIVDQDVHRAGRIGERLCGVGVGEVGGDETGRST